jgi:capsular polysaccharide biosynthesis protein
VVEAIINQLRTVAGLIGKVDIHLSQIIAGERETVPPDILARAAILIEEAAPWRGSGTLSPEERAQLPKDCATITIPTLHFNSLWPLMTEDPRNVAELGAPYGRIPFAMGDRLALNIVHNEPDPLKRRQIYDAIDFGAAVNLRRSHELEVRNFFERERGCDVRVAAFVVSQFREKRLFYTHAHPTGELMYFILAQLYAIPVLRDLIRLPYDELVVAAKRWSVQSNVFVGEDAPIHPAVANYFGLKWWREDLLYRRMHQSRTFDGWTNWYLTYQPGQAELPVASESAVAPPPWELNIGPYLLPRRASLADVIELEPGHTVLRPAFLVANQIDSGVAPYGALLSHEKNSSYNISPTFLAALPGARVLGDTGLVDFQSEVVADTARHIEYGKNAPLIHEMNDHFIRFHVGQPAASRALEGSYFCGFAGGWSNFDLWCFCTLPRLFAYRLLSDREPGVRLIVPERLLKFACQMEALELLGIGPDQIETVGPYETLKCEKLYNANVFDLWQFSPFAARAAKDLALRADAGAADAPEIDLYLRSARPQAENAAEMEEILEARGFVTVAIEELSLKERIRTIGRARCIVGPTTPLASSLLFARPGTPVLELFEPSQPQPLGWTIAANMGLAYGFLVGRTTTGGGFRIETEALENAVAALSLALPKLVGAV